VIEKGKGIILKADVQEASPAEYIITALLVIVFFVPAVITPFPLIQQG
jgi:hypothetical protein